MSYLLIFFLIVRACSCRSAGRDTVPIRRSADTARHFRVPDFALRGAVANPGNDRDQALGNVAERSDGAAQVA